MRITLLRSHHATRALLGSAAAGAAAVVLLATLPASALVVDETPTPVTGSTTYFDGLGQPYGGCGLPQSVLESQDFVALNVYNTPGDYTFYPRPLPASQADKIGMWNNGRNCGRWIQVTVGDYCTGINDGAPNQPFCRNGSWVADAYKGATLTMLIADSCGDANAWCRDDPYHIDLAKASLNRFVLGGTQVGDMYPNHYNNRRMTWQFVPAPHYTGDIQIGFLQGAQVWWPAIAISRLPDGVHGVEYFQNGSWQQAQMNSDMGQSYIIGGTTAGANQFQIRVRDASAALLNGGRVYSFALPAACGSSCSAAYTSVSYTISNPTTTTTTSRPPTTTTTTSRPPTTTTTTTTSLPPTTTTTTSGARTCTATYAVTGQWTGGFQGEVVVRNTGAQALSGWRVTWSYANGERVTQLWNGVLGSGGPDVAVTNESYNGGVGVNASTTFGFLGSRTDTSPAPTVACAAS